MDHPPNAPRKPALYRAEGNEAGAGGGGEPENSDSSAKSAGSIKAPSANSCFAGGGEAARILGEIDWSTRPVGPVSGWPQSLQTSLNICLSSRYPICILWGPERTYFYNDAYAPIVGEKHPKALGDLYPNVWPEIWEPVIKPILEEVERTGEASWGDNILLVLRRYGFNEECYFLFSFAPIRLENGSVGGVFTAITETTRQLVGERRLRTLKDLATRAPDAKSADEACRVANEVLSGNSHDVPFSLFYLIDADSSVARLVDAQGIDRNETVSPRQVSLTTTNEKGSPWPFAEVIRKGAPIILREINNTLGPLPGGPWEEETQTAVVVPIARPGQTIPYGFFVAGVSPRRALDADYESFLSLVAAQVATAISNARAYEEERRRAEVLAELDRAKTIFFSNVSHEFRTPLTLMLGPLEELLTEGENHLSAEVRPKLELAHRNSLRLLKLVNALLDFSRLEAGRVQADLEPTDLARFTVDLCGMFRSAVEKAGMRLVVDCPALAEPVYVDREMWEKIVLNLLSNAFKFTLEGEIRVEMRLSNGTVQLRVADSGIGIPESELGNIFKRFHRVEGVRGRTFEGSGIGLALVQELVKLHGGSIAVKSTVGVGTEFTISLPVRPKERIEERTQVVPDPNPVPAKARAFVEEALRWLPQTDRALNGHSTMEPALKAGPTVSDRTDRSSRTQRILVADDNADMRDYVVRLLTPRFQVVVAHDGEAALASARESKPDLILTDVMMPGLDGFGLLRAIRADTQLRTVPVILLSARAGEESRIEGLDAGADDYLIKPFSARELIARVESHLHLAQFRRESFATEQRLREEAAMERQRATDILESISDGFFALDAEWRFTYVNRSAEKLLGKPVAELVGRSHWEEFPASIGTIVEREFRRAASSQSSVEFQSFYAPWRRWFDVKAYPWAKGLAVYFRDITGRKKAEDELTAAHRRLAEQVDGLTRLHQLSTRLMNPRETAHMLHSILESMAALHHSDKGLLLLADESEEFLRVGASLGFSDVVLTKLKRVPAGFAASGVAFGERRRVIVEGIESDPLFENHRALARLGNFRAVHSTPILTRDGRALGVISVHFSWPRKPSEVQIQLSDMYARQAADFLERRQVEDALRHSELRMRTLAESLPNLVWTCLADGSCDWLSSQWRQYTGIPESDLLGSNWLEQVIHPEDRETTRRCWKAACEDTGVYDLEQRIRRHDGVYRWFKTRGVPIRGPEGRIVHWFGTCTDIEEMKQAELAIHRLAAIVEHSEDAILSINLEGTIQSWNRGAERLYGYSNDEAIGRHVMMLIPKECSAQQDQIMASILAGESVENCETQRRRKDGSLFDVSLTVSPVKDRDGKIVGVSKVARDISDKVRAKERLEKTVAERTASLREAIAQMEEFSYSVSHDLRSPVRAMHGYARALAEDFGDGLNADARFYVDRIIHGTVRMERLIHDVLTYSRIGRMEIKLQTVPLDDLMRSVMDQYPELNSGKVDIVIAPNLPTVLAHEPALGQALANLLSNAVKFVARGTRPRVEVSAERTDRHVLVKIRDNGIGIKPEHQRRLFGMFERVHPEGKYEGTGIGLAIVRKSIERMGGQVGVESDGVNGSTFWIQLSAGERTEPHPPQQPT